MFNNNDRVRVINNLFAAEATVGEQGIVIDVDRDDAADILVEFADGSEFWGSSKGLALVDADITELDGIKYTKVVGEGGVITLTPYVEPAPAVTPAAGQIWSREVGGEINYYVIADTEVGSENEEGDTVGLRFINLKSGAVYKRSSLFGKRGKDRFTYEPDIILTPGLK